VIGWGRVCIALVITGGVASVAASPNSAAPAAKVMSHLMASNSILTRQVAQATTSSTMPTLKVEHGQFRAGSKPISLHGTTTFIGQGNPHTYAMAAGWGMNVVRLRFHWTLLEPTAPTKIHNGTWKHAYSTSYVHSLVKEIGWARQNGLYCILVNYPDRNYFFQFPDWLFKAPYNSHNKTYARTPDGIAQEQTNFWTDSLQKQFMGDMWSWLAGQLAGNSGVSGLEVLPEPRFGALDPTTRTTQLMLDSMLRVAQRIRANDPTPVIFFMSRGAKDFGLADTDLSGWRALGDVALDLHDYFGARFGSGVTTNRADPGFDETTQALYSSVANPWDTATSPYYIGDTLGHVRFLSVTQDWAAVWGIPVMVGEFGDYASDVGTARYLGTVTSALKQVPAVSWCVNIGSLIHPDLTLTPYAWIVLRIV
jgi:hypothetical protein